MVNRRRAGFSHERDLVKRLWDYGFAVMRAPASGSKARRVLYPDIIAIYNGKVLVVEAKTCRKGKYIYIRKDQCEKLVEFAKRSGGSAYVAVKKVGSGEWHFIPISNVEKLESGNYRVDTSNLGEAIRLEALVNMVKGAKQLTEFMKRGEQRG